VPAVTYGESPGSLALGVPVAYTMQPGSMTDDEGGLLKDFWGPGMRADLVAATPAAMVGYGDALKIAPPAVMRGYLELVSRAAQPGVAPLVQGMKVSARTGTGRGVGAAIGGADALVKTGTAPCSHSPRATAAAIAFNRRSTLAREITGPQLSSGPEPTRTAAVRDVSWDLNSS